MARAGLTTARVAVAGADLADEIGFESVTITLLARRLGVRTPSLYSHVAGSDELRLRISEVALTESATLLGKALDARSGDDALSVYAACWRDFARVHPGRYAATRQRVPDVDSGAGRAVLAAGRRHADVGRAVLSAYHLEGPEQTHAVRLLGSLVHGYVSLELAGSFAHSEPPSGESWTYLIGALDRLLRST